MKAASSPKDRSEAIQQVARRLLEQHKIDITEQVELLPLARELVTLAGCRLDTARRHMATAVRRARGEETAKHGGKRAGAGRKPAHEAPKEQRSVALSPRAWAFVALMALQLDCSENEVIERLIRTHPSFVPEAPDQT